MKIPLILFILFCSGLESFGQDDGFTTGIIYGGNHAFSLTAPEGWVLDNKSGVSQGLDAVFYKKGESWKKAGVVMYTNTASLEDEAHKNLEQLIKYDIDNFKRNYDGIEVVDGKDILVKDSVVAKVKYLSGKSYDNFEAMAYINAGKTGVMIVMSSRTKEGFDDCKGAFETLVKSYLFIANKVIIDKQK